jgi:pimeloyl-ACP methyl ester carboxylesterase
LKRKFLMVLTLAILMIATSLTAGVQATPKGDVIRRQIGTTGIMYTQTTIVLGRALDAIKIPDSWNGKLVVLCRGGLSVDLNAVPMDLYTVFLRKGFATAASTYGVNGMCVKEGMIRTHQLTEYVLDNYDVTGNVYLFGMSMGGSVALELGAKYPDVYSGVLDMSGLKNMITQFDDAVYYSGIANDGDLAAALIAKDGLVPPYPPYPMPTIAAFRDNEVSAVSAFIAACGGTPDEKMQAYERISPTFSATDITVPTITVHGTKDGLAPYSTALEFMNAVTTAGHSDMYRLYKVINGQHGDSSVTGQISPMLDRLVNWVEQGTIPSPSIP